VFQKEPVRTLRKKQIQIWILQKPSKKFSMACSQIWGGRIVSDEAAELARD
jgi:hypothetical protein